MTERIMKSVRLHADICNRIEELYPGDFSRGVNELLQIGINHWDEKPLIAEDEQAEIFKILLRIARDHGMVMSGSRSSKESLERAIKGQHEGFARSEAFLALLILLVIVTVFLHLLEVQLV